MAKNEPRSIFTDGNAPTQRRTNSGTALSLFPPGHGCGCIVIFGSMRSGKTAKTAIPISLIRRKSSDASD